ncbi:hypothetical protein FE257_008501 [Aspergillus nanangensis]|uniref:Uncharacterized protein n=1 Tax=Aspergillus nanangensis TaxID=2582783 RepID=A0AAD4GSJ9_ASPNN|nr:hypothetical protein FE257_008501 [Aspergillus nanangensis]
MSTCPTESHWQQRRQYPDHLGHPVVLEEYIEPGWTPEPVHQVAIQVYSTIPLDTDHTQLRDYLLNSFYNDKVKPLFEIYSYCPPDAFACIEHHRREIAHRKQQHTLGTEDPPPLIPQFFHSSYESPIGCCILLHSHSYRLGYTEDDDAYTEAGAAPDWLYFNRVFPNSRSNIDQVHRVDSATADAGSGPRELYPEAFDTEVRHVRNQREIGQRIMQDIFQNACGFDEGQNSLHYAMDVDEGTPSDPIPLPSGRIRQQLDQQFIRGRFDFPPLFTISQKDWPITTTNVSGGADPDLQYLVFASFLSHITEFAPLRIWKTASLFTTALMRHLPPGKTFHLEFHIPKSSDWSAILDAHNKALSHHEGGFAVGALYTLPSGDESPTPRRVFPQTRSDSVVTTRSLEKHYGVFAVVLDKPNFVTDAGVCFYMDDYDDSNESGSDSSEFPDIQIWRSAGMREVVRRLAMLAVGETLNGATETRTLLLDD